MAATGGPGAGPPRDGFDPVDRFVERVEEYRATAARVAPAGLARAIARSVRERGARSLAVPEDLPAGWLSELDDTIEVVRDSAADPLQPARLDGVDGALTGCALAIAETGTLALDCGPAQGRRVLTLLPDYHLCIVRRDQIVPSVPDGVAALRDAAAAGRPITLVSGPSATSDIELTRVEGVHGPRTLAVLITDPDTAPGER